MQPYTYSGVGGFGAPYTLTILPLPFLTNRRSKASSSNAWVVVSSSSGQNFDLLDDLRVEVSTKEFPSVTGWTEELLPRLFEGLSLKDGLKRVTLHEPYPFQIRAYTQTCIGVGVQTMPCRMARTPERSVRSVARGSTRRGYEAEPGEEGTHTISQLLRCPQFPALAWDRRLARPPMALGIGCPPDQLNGLRRSHYIYNRRFSRDEYKSNVPPPDMPRLSELEVRQSRPSLCRLQRQP